MQQLSPRGYVFIGLEVIREPLIKIIGKVLQKQGKSWWYDYIYYRMVSVEKDFPRTGTVKDLYKYLDELVCLKILKGNYQLFKEYIGFKLIEDLIGIRHECIHIFEKGRISVRNFANDTLLKMACAMEKIDTAAQKTILSYRSQLNTQTVNENQVVASKEALVMFLKVRVWDITLKLFQEIDTIEKAEKEQLKDSMEKSLAYINDELQNSTDIVNWFNKNLCSFEGIKMYLRLKNINVNIPTFEDVRIDFYNLCYGSY
jgi:hypothetical protein